MARRVIALVIKIKANSPRLSALVPPIQTSSPLTHRSQLSVLNNLQPLLQKLWQFFLLDETHLHAVSPEEHDTVLGVAEVVKLVRSEVLLLHSVVKDWDLGLDDTPRDPVCMIGRAPPLRLLQQSSHALVSLLLVGSLCSAPSTRRHSCIKHEFHDRAGAAGRRVAGG